MGYAHYWLRPVELPADTFAIWSDEVARVIAVAGIPLERLEGEPAATPARVAFVGERDAGLEWFIVEQTCTRGFPLDTDSSNQDKWHYGFGWRGHCCKTGRLPYDAVVVAALALLYYYFPNQCEVDSDGTVADWQTGIDLAERVTGLHLYAPNYKHGIQSWPLPADIFAKWSADVERVIKTTDVPIAGPDGTGMPIVTPSEVVFNGIGQDGCEPFRLIGELVHWPDFPNHYWFGHEWQCKTMGNAGKRYDEVVTAVLLLLQHYFDDACWVWTQASIEQWQPGRDLVERATGLSLSVSLDRSNRRIRLD